MKIRALYWTLAAVLQWRQSDVLSAPSIDYASFLGEGAHDQPRAVAVDARGNTYVAGRTTGRYPIKKAYQSRFGGGNFDGVLTKFDPSGKIVYSTYLGGRSDDAINAIDVDSSGNVYLTGETNSIDFPVTTNSFNQSFTGTGFNIFAARLNASGTSLLFSTLIGGDNVDIATAIVSDQSGGCRWEFWPTSSEAGSCSACCWLCLSAWVSSTIRRKPCRTRSPG